MNRLAIWTHFACAKVKENIETGIEYVRTDNYLNPPKLFFSETGFLHSITALKKNCHEDNTYFLITGTHNSVSLSYCT